MVQRTGYSKSYVDPHSVMGLIWSTWYIAKADTNICCVLYSDGKFNLLKRKKDHQQWEPDLLTRFDGFGRSCIRFSVHARDRMLRGIEVKLKPVQVSNSESNCCFISVPSS